MALKRIDWRSAADSFFERAQKVKKAHRLLIIFGLVLLLGGGFAWFVYMPRMQEIDRTEKEIADLHRRINMGKMWGKKLVALQEEKAQVEEEFRKALKILPNEREIPSLLAGISQLGVDSNLQFRLFSPGNEALRNFYVEIPVSMEVGGRFREVILFLDKISRMERIVNIVDISLRPSAPLSEDLITSCKAVTYRFKSKEDEAKEKAQQQKKK
ncbi:MAG: type 4a pilus biogenesis protein PilO [Deltaproteobacteria bacterium]|nr:type 4a pilus biogenesis protein PilO [Deltaproteobacteria bacterium]